MSLLDEYLGELRKEDIKTDAQESGNPLLNQYLQELDESDERQTRGNIRAVAQGLTFGFADEIEAMLSSDDYETSVGKIREEHELYQLENPLASTSFELLGAIPTLAVGGLGAAKFGAKAIPKIAGAEGAVYGVGSGDTIEERAVQGAFGGLAGYGLAKVVMIGSSALPNGGLKGNSDFLSDKQIAQDMIDGMTDQRLIEKARTTEVFTEVSNPAYAKQSLRDAKTAGELWEGLGGAFQRFYNDKVTGASDALMRDVSPYVGAIFQRFDQKALLKSNKELNALSEDLIPIAKTVNQDSNLKGILLDYGSGKMGHSSVAFTNLRNKLRADGSLSNKDTITLLKYLRYSRKKNEILNKKVFGAKYPKGLTYLHTRNNAYLKQLKDEGLSEAEIEQKMLSFDDPGQQRRTRGSYIKGEVSPDDYDNPIITDMQRIFKMERLSQLQDGFGVDINDIIKPRLAMAGPRDFVSVTPDEFMLQLHNTLVKKGISNDGADYAVAKMSDTIMGQTKAPHPLIQALNSVAYATTLAGPMSAILNIADAPLVGAKYGSAAANEAMKSVAKSMMPKPFKKPDGIDLEVMGLNNQAMGEFVSQMNTFAGNPNWASKTAEGARQTTDFLMRKSGFAAMDLVGKKGVMKGVLKSAVDDAQAGKLADNWAFYFNNAELTLISKQLKAHGTDFTKYTGKGKELVEDLMFSGLGQQQLISAAGRPAAWARNPNLRPLWALRGFVIKQQALALREVMGNIKAGRKDKAVEFLGRYALYGAGGYGVINEARQGVFGDGNISANGLIRSYGDAWASLISLNTVGLNDYQYGQIKQHGLLYTIFDGLKPIAYDRPLDIIGDVADFFDGDKYGREVVTRTLPIVDQTAGAVANIGGMLGLDDIARPAEKLLERKPRSRD